MRIVTVVGARPQFIKAATVSRAVGQVFGIEEVLVHTGQHYDKNMSEVFFEEMDIPQPVYNLGIGSGSHGAQTGRMMESIEKVLVSERPDWVLVYGDTNSTLAGAVAAVKLHIRVAHIEAGLRSFNRAMPEEINRILTDHAANLLFAPTKIACKNLELEGLKSKTIRTGDVMLDASRYYASKAADRDVSTRFHLQPKSYCLATVHRAENTDDICRLRNMMGAFTELSRSMPVIFPMHPRTRSRLADAAVDLARFPDLRITEPVGYLDMILLEKNARLIATDSGGVQKEAYFFSVPCVTMRTETEWVELVDNGFNFLGGTDKDAILASFKRALEAKPDWTLELYGNGSSAQCIVAELHRRS